MNVPGCGIWRIVRVGLANLRPRIQAFDLGVNDGNTRYHRVQRCYIRYADQAVSP
jgi:hypothetical protein